MSGVARKAGIVVALLLVVLTTGASASSLLTDDTIAVTARFDNAAGVFVGNPVSVLGMQIGKITRVEQKGPYAEVGMELEASVRISADATAVIVSDSLLTDRHIEFTPPYVSGPVLDNGAVLDLDRTKTPVEFDSLLAMAQKLSTSLQGDGEGNGPIAGLVDIGAATTSGNGDAMKAALDQLSRALRLGDDHGAAARDAITTIVENLSDLTDAAARNDGTIRDFGSGVGQLSDLLADQDLGSGDTGTKLVEILSQTADLLQKYRGQMSSTVSGTANLMNTFSDYRGEIAEFLDVFPMLTDNAYNGVDQNIGAGRVHVNLDKVVLNGQMVKEVCNLLDLKQLGCNTGKVSDMGPDFGVTSMLAGIAGLPQ